MLVTAGDVMNPDPAVATPETLLRDAAERVLAGGTTDLYVVNERGRLRGVLHDYDLLKLGLTDPHLPGTVASRMSRQVAAVSVEDSAVEVALRFRDAVVRSVPVVADELLVGQLTRAELLPLLLRQEPASARPSASAGTPAAPSFNVPRPPHFATSGESLPQQAACSRR